MRHTRSSFRSAPWRKCAPLARRSAGSCLSGCSSRPQAGGSWRGAVSGALSADERADRVAVAYVTGNYFFDARHSAQPRTSDSSDRGAGVREEPGDRPRPLVPADAIRGRSVGRGTAGARQRSAVHGRGCGGLLRAARPGRVRTVAHRLVSENRRDDAPRALRESHCWAEGGYSSHHARHRGIRSIHLGTLRTCFTTSLSVRPFRGCGLFDSGSGHVLTSLPFSMRKGM